MLTAHVCVVRTLHEDWKMLMYLVAKEHEGPREVERGIVRRL